MAQEHRKRKQAEKHQGDRKTSRHLDERDRGNDVSLCRLEIAHTSQLSEEGS